MSNHRASAVRPNTEELHSPMRTDNVEKARHKKKHILSCMMFKHWNSESVYIVKFTVEMDTDMAREDNPRQSSPRITSEARRIHEARMICHPRRGILDISRPVKMSWFRGRGWVMIPVSRTRMTLPSPPLPSPP